MKIDFKSEIFEEYVKLKNELSSDSTIINLVEKRNDLNLKLKELDQYSSDYQELKSTYDMITNDLLINNKYSHFKMLERELNLFVMYCNKELEELFALNKKECNK